MEVNSNKENSPSHNKPKDQEKPERYTVNSRTIYSEEYKNKVLHYAFKHSYSEACDFFNVPRPILIRWKRLRRSLVCKLDNFEEIVYLLNCFMKNHFRREFLKQNDSNIFDAVCERKAQSISLPKSLYIGTTHIFYKSRFPAPFSVQKR